MSELSPERRVSGISAELRQEFIAYVTGRLATDEHNALEERLLKDEEFSQLAMLLEQDILEDYAAGSLTSAEQEVLRPWVTASARHRELVQVTRLLLQNSRRRRVHRGISVWLWLAAAACVCVAAVLFARYRMPATPPIAARGPAQVSPQSTKAEANVILLVAERLRGPATQKEITYVVANDSPTRIQVLLPGAVSGMGYGLLLRHADDRFGEAELVRIDGLALQHASAERFIEITLPPGRLAPGAYIAQVMSKEGSFAVRFCVRAR